MNIGLDIVDIKRTKKIIKRTSSFVEKLMHEDEVESLSIESICGKIAAKEAIVKTGYMKAGQWKKVKIISLPSGEPLVCDEQGKLIQKLHISISHTDQLAIAAAVYE